MRAAIDALEDAFRSPVPDVPLRAHVETAAGSMLLMPATGAQGSGVKIVTLTPANPARGLPLIDATYVLADPETQEIRATFDGAALTALRTAAVSGLATRRLARDDAARLVVFGAGVQARAHVEAMRAVRPIRHLTVVSRTGARAEALCDESRASGLEARVGIADDVREADLVCTCTTSPAPVFAGSLLAPGSHVNAVGAYTTDTRELDEDAVLGARVVVETREVARAEAGALCIPAAEGRFTWGDVAADLHELVTGPPVRRSAEDRTVFLSEGFAYEDLVVAAAAVERL